jgi:hypothetical protein
MLRRVREYHSHRFRKKRCLRLLWMNTAQITHALEQDPVTSKKFCGVFPSDKLPRKIDRYPRGFVPNTDPSSELERTGSPFISHRMIKENYLTVTDMPLSTIGNRLGTF